MKLPVHKIFWTLIAATVGILAIHSFFVLSNHFFSQSLPEFLVQRFLVDGEANVPTWYSTILLFSVSLTAFLLYRLDDGFHKAGSLLQKFWLVFGIVYLFLSLDEAAQLHEILDQLTKVKWVFIYGPVIGLFFFVCLYYFVVVRRKDSTLRNWIIGGLIIYALGGLVCEAISYTFVLRYALRQIEYVVEEGFELLGTIMVLTGCLYEFNEQIGKKFQESE